MPKEEWKEGKMKVNIVKELLDNHSDEEIVAYLEKMATGIVGNYKTAANANQPQLLFGNLGDVTMVATILRAMKNRNDARNSLTETER